MAELADYIKKQIAVGLKVYLDGFQNLSRDMGSSRPPKFFVGDGIQFDVFLKNDNALPLNDLEVTVHPVIAVEFEEGPPAIQLQDIGSGEEVKVATITGVVRANPDDAKSAWRFMDNVCRVTITGQVDLPPIEFHDEEFEVAHIEDA